MALAEVREVPLLGQGVAARSSSAMVMSGRHCRKHRKGAVLRWNLLLRLHPCLARPASPALTALTRTPCSEKTWQGCELHAYSHSAPGS